MPQLIKMFIILLLGLISIAIVTLIFTAIFCVFKIRHNEYIKHDPAMILQVATRRRLSQLNEPVRNRPTKSAKKTFSGYNTD